MVEIDLRHISVEKNRHGRRVVYARWKGRRIRLKAPEGTPEFIEEYRAALVALGVIRAPIAAEQTVPKAEEKIGEPINREFLPHTFGWLVRRYLAESPKYREMKPDGRARRRTILEAMLPTVGNKGMIIPRQVISEGLTARADKPGAANNWIKSVKALYTWAVSVEIIKESPASGLSKLEQPNEGFHTWSMQEISAYIKRHPPGSMGYLALMTLLFTGLRRSDAVALGRQHIRDNCIRIKTGKTGAEIVTDVPWPLADAIAVTAHGDDLSILQTTYGRKFASGAAFGNWFKDRCAEADIPHCTPHGLRKAGATIAAENGASEVELDAMYGWSNQRQSGTYTRAARNRVLATAGFERIANALVRANVIEQRKPRIVAP